MLSIGTWVLREACKQARAWVDAAATKKSLTSEAASSKRRLQEELFAILNETGLDPGYLELDVAACVLMKHLERTTSILRFVQNKGVQVSADNLGAGYPNFGRLRKLPLNALKIDRSFVRKIESNPENKTKVSAIINLGHRMNLRVIAEGVESVEHLEFLCVTGLDISKTFVELARKNAAEARARAEFREGNASQMPFAANSFDLLVCRAAFKNFSEPERALKEMHRVLRPGGTGVIIDLRRDVSMKEIKRYIDGLSLSAWSRWLTTLTFRFMLLKRAYTEQELEKMLQGIGFEKAEVRTNEIGMEAWFEK